jgi:hypothetical protein
MKDGGKDEQKDKRGALREVVGFLCFGCGTILTDSALLLWLWHYPYRFSTVFPCLDS